MISTRNLSKLPEIDTLRRLMQSLAMLDAILSPDWVYRYFSFNSHWAIGEQMGSMRNGQGDHYFALFNAAGCWLKGFDHEAIMSPFASNPPKVATGVLNGVPAEFAAYLAEPAFVVGETTFCIWRLYGDTIWRRGTVMLLENNQDADGSASLLQYLDCVPQTYSEWAKEYYECDVSLPAVRSIYAHQPLDQLLVRELNAEILLADLKSDIQEIGYPKGMTS